MDLGVGGASVDRHWGAWRRLRVGHWPGRVNLLDLHVQLRNKRSQTNLKQRRKEPKFGQKNIWLTW